MPIYSHYKKIVIPELMKEFDLGSIMAVPKVEKVVVNIGIGDIKDSRDEQEKIVAEFAKIVGQKPSLRLAKKSVAGFGTRKGQPVGVAATLRGRRMYDFLEKLFNIVLPRLRDFHGVSRSSFDSSGNYTLGIVEHTVFPEVDLGKATKVHGFEITIVTNTRDKEKSARLLELLGMPFEKGK